MVDTVGIYRMIENRLIPDPQLFTLEIITAVPMENLVYSICDFYWNMNFRTIKIIRDPRSYGTYVDYDPSLEIKNADEIQEILIITRKKNENKQVFDSIDMALTQTLDKKTKIEWNVDFGFKDWQLIYFLIAFLIGLYYAGKIEISGNMAGLILIALIIPVYFLGFYRAKKVEKHPSIGKHKQYFEEFIHDKEKELLS
jgi:hypothetical protein